VVVAVRMRGSRGIQNHTLLWVTMLSRFTRGVMVTAVTDWCVGVDVRSAGAAGAAGRHGRWTYVIGEIGHTRGGGLGEAGGVGAVHGTVGDIRITRGATGVVGAARCATGIAGAASGRKLGGTIGTRRGAVETTPGGVESSELGTSSSVAVCGTVDPVRRGVPMGGTTGASSISKKSKLSVGWGEAAKGKIASSKTTCREITRRLVERSRQR
jgi:hypothetical protein